jgi:hypothetical protein
VLKRLLLATTASLLLAAVAFAEQTPAGYVMSVELHGEDAAQKTAIIREGKELPPKLMMPLYAKDVIFLRDGESRIGIEFDGGTEKEIAGANARFEVKGEVATGDDAWSLISAVAAVIGGDEGEAVPDNMVARGSANELKIPMAVHGANFLVGDGAPLWLAWSGGKAPYTVVVEAGGRSTEHDKIAVQELEFAPPPPSTKRFTVTVKDAEGRAATVVMRYHNGLPQPGSSFKGKLPQGEAKGLVYAAWLTGLHDGDWSIEAAQLLRKRPATDTQAKILLEKIVQGWKHHQ